MARTARHHAPRPAAALEQGTIRFFQERPTAESPLEDEDREPYSMVLEPAGTPRRRLVRLGRRHPPATGRGGEHFRGVVESVRGSDGELEEDFGGQGRAAGVGAYVIARHGDHVHFAYSLERPVRAGPLQRALGIEEEASYILNVRNPETMHGPCRPILDPDLQGRFRGRKYLPADPPAFLDVEGCELLFVVVRRTVEKELGLRFRRVEEDAYRRETLRDLESRKQEAPVEPLLQGGGD